MRKILVAFFFLILASVALAQATAPYEKTISKRSSMAPMAATSHSIVLTWTASTSSGVVSYGVYRGTTSGGPYSLLTTVGSTPPLTYTDTAVAGGTIYYYVVSAVDGSGNESGYSNQASAAPLANPNPPTGLTAVGH